MQNTPTIDEEFAELVRRHPFEKELIEACVAYGLRYQQVPISMAEQLEDKHISLEVISEYCLDQLDAMPSKSFH